MESFYLAVSVVLPLLIYMVIGGIVRKCRMYSYENFKALNGLIFKLFIPLALFVDVYKSNLGDAFQPKIFLFVGITIMGGWVLCWIYFTRTVDTLADQATMIQGVFRSNYVLFGATIGAAMCDAEGVALMAALAAMTVPIFNIMSVVTFELKRGGKIQAGKLIRGIFSNPLVDAAIMAIAVNFLPFRLPDLVITPLSKLASAASPVALVTLGGMLSFGSIVKHRNLLVQAVLGRLVIIPAIAIALALLLGFRGNSLIAILAVFGSPTAVASGPMAQAMGGNGPLAGEIIALTSTVSIITIFLWVFFLSSMGWI